MELDEGHCDVDLVLCHGDSDNNLEDEEVFKVVRREDVFCGLEDEGGRDGFIGETLRGERFVG